MVQVLDPLLIVSLALNFVALSMSRIRGVINAVAVQGVLLGVFPLFLHPDIGLRVIVLAVGIVCLKGLVIPAFLVHAMREANIQHEVTPIGSYMSSLLLGAIGTGLALVFSYTLPLAAEHTDLLLENGIFLFGLLLLDAMPFLVEMGILLDLFTGVFVMGIIIHHISREFSSISTEHLTELKE
jgi:hydrogenase-4 component E